MTSALQTPSLATAQMAQTGMQFGLMFFASGEDNLEQDRYRLVIESAKFADQNGFSSIWIPERHFTPLGCLYPNPVVLQAALARETQNIRLQAGSVVLPLHDPIRVAEEWAMVDNLSDGRVGLSFASGWNPGDFAFFPERYDQRWQVMEEGIQTVQKLWRGDSISVQGGDGQFREIRVYPTPVQKQLPLWVTAASNPKTFAKAGELGANLLTHLFDQDLATLAQNIALYRQTSVEYGHCPGKVTVTLHTYMGHDLTTVREEVRHPYCSYLKANLPLLQGLSYSRGQSVDLGSLSETDLDQMTDRIFEKFYSEGRALLGTSESCQSLVEQLHHIGVNEIACLLDFGPHPDLILQTLPHLNRLRAACKELTEASVSIPVHLPEMAADSEDPAQDVQDLKRNTIAAIQGRCDAIANKAFYQTLKARGVELDSSFQGIEQLWRTEGEAIATIKLPAHLNADDYSTHPALLDACLQVLWATLPEADTVSYLPIGLGELTILEALDGPLYSHAVLTSQADELTGDVRVLDADGTVKMTLQGIRLQPMSIPCSQIADWFYQVEWRPCSLPELQDTTLTFDSVSQIANQVRQQTRIEKLDVYRDLLPQLNTLSRDFILWAFWDMDLNLQPGQPFPFAALRQQIQPQHHRLLHRLIEVLTEQDILIAQGANQWQIKKVPTLEAPAQRLQGLQTHYPACQAEISLLGRCGQGLASVLQGQDPLNLLFPDGSVADVEALYQDSPAAQVANQWVVDAIATAIQDLPTDRTIRILEIGAGTGGTTAYVLPQLPGYRTEYTFTDVSFLFTAKAEEKFADYPFIDYRLLDIEKAPSEQGFESQSFDIILAANVLHATADLQQTVEHIHQLLEPGGLLIALEGMEPQAWLDLIFGLTPGWWSFTDTDLRPSYPLISSAQWQQLLQANQFDAEIIAANRDGLSQQAVLVASSQRSQQPGTWLVFCDLAGIGKAFAELLQSRGEICQIIETDSADLTSFQSLFTSSTSDDYRGVVYLWGLNDLNQSPLETSWNTATPVALIQAMEAANVETPLWLVTQGSQSVAESQTNATQSMLWGLGQVLAVEQPQRYGGLIDLDPAASVSQAAADLLQSIQPHLRKKPTNSRHSPPRIGGPGGPTQSEVLPGQNLEIENTQSRTNDAYLDRDTSRQDFTGPPSPPILGGKQMDSRVSPSKPGRTMQHGKIAFRQNQSFSPHLTPYRAALAQNSAQIKATSYLITGGLGDLGLRVATWLSEQGAKHLILLGRTSLPPRHQWLSLPSKDTAFQKIQAIQAIEAQGTQVHLATADVADPEQLAQEIESVDVPPIQGVFHLAMEPPQLAPIEQVDLEQLDKILSPKAAGAWNLHQYFAEQSLDYFVLFSSWAGLLGSVGQQLSGYSMANSYLDSLAHHRRSLGLPALSIDWGDWSEIGLRSRSIKAGQRLLPESWTLTPEQGLQALGQLMHEQGQIAFLPVPWSEFFDLFPTAKSQPLLADVANQASASDSQPPPALLQDWEALPPAARLQALKNHVQAIVAQVMGISSPSAIDPDRGLFESGMDSLMALEVKNHLETSLGETIPAVAAFEHPTVNALATYLAKSTLGWEAPSVPATAPVAETTLDKISQLSDDDVDRLFDEKFARQDPSE
ncbi:Phthiocerol/phenolphthiocerol synthesis polyketide synthase type I PpsC [Acaryochloris thomasi RCC1774]|uniref:Phthiocerol/phenolphthiocerol synthesis polyketide synthase type I PpsC n=1 Tax=Acaryochloris thomasi RCC1774 TaxID=1764569 RepID=A0A2W1JV39_9CYAN|nr:MupA/Atu3671 family FMN-dependent luciferase-like monooxygenase [Acaryochloris thomasi]PZD72651.1 Phthiocerol/phenolphthiocerol synthesis polyketide synthase type I PpsC [Acaryochloris thomasi RCC1774]